MTGAIKSFSRRLAVSVPIIALVLASYPTVGSAATINVTVAPNGNMVFMPSSVTIHPGDQVKRTWGAGVIYSPMHSSTSGTPGAPNGLWDSGLLGQGAVFTHTFNTAGTFHYYCTVHGACCGMRGVVTVTNPSPTPTPTPIPGPPIVTTNPATLIAAFSARLNGSVNPHGLTTTFHFRYGLTTSYGLTTPPQNRSGTTPQNVSAVISGLMANRVYHFRIVASNARGTRVGVDRTFTTRSPTGLPIVITNPATNVASHSATLNGLVYPHGLTTTVRFQYGRTTSYGRTTAMQTRTGNTYRNIAANISALAAHTTYHFRIIATNSVGTRMGRDRTFTTP